MRFRGPTALEDRLEKHVVPNEHVLKSKDLTWCALPILPRVIFMNFRGPTALNDRVTIRTLSSRNPSGNRGRWTEGSRDVISGGGVRTPPATPKLARGE
jgi:hypothetical protein